MPTKVTPTEARQGTGTTGRVLGTRHLAHTDRNRRPLTRLGWIFAPVERHFLSARREGIARSSPRADHQVWNKPRRLLRQSSETERQLMRSKIGIITAVILLVASSVTVSKRALAAPNVRDAIDSVQSEILLRAHGCHRYWEMGWSNVYGRNLVHRHGDNCRPEAKRWDDGYWRHRRYGGPPPGWRSHQRAPYGWQRRGCLQFGPLWYCP
jgi:hypothetical protein